MIGSILVALGVFIVALITVGLGTSDTLKTPYSILWGAYIVAVAIIVVHAL